MNGSYSRPLPIGTWMLEIEGNRNIEVLYKNEVPLQQTSQFHTFINSKMNHWTAPLHLLLTRQKWNYTWRYMPTKVSNLKENSQSVEFDAKPHGNRK